MNEHLQCMFLSPTDTQTRWFSSHRAEPYAAEWIVCAEWAGHDLYAVQSGQGNWQRKIVDDCDNVVELY
jgi:hypothetical protein